MTSQNNPLKVLVVEDQETWQDDVEGAVKLLDSAAQIDIVTNSQEALSLIDKNDYDLAIVDLSLSAPPNDPASDIEGLEVVASIRQNLNNQNCPIVIHTGRKNAVTIRKVEQELGKNSYLIEFEDKDEFSEEAFVEMLRSTLTKADQRQSICILTFTVKKKRLHFKFEGALEVLEDGGKLKLSRKEYNRRIARFGNLIYGLHDLWLKTEPIDKERVLSEQQYEEKRNAWREEAKEIGKEFYKQLFDLALPEKRHLLHRNWGAALNALNGREENLVLRFNGGVNNLALPFELLDDSMLPLILRHPISRQINRTRRNTRYSWQEFVDLQRKNETPIKALLAATDKEAMIEINKVERQLMAFAQKVNIELQIESNSFSPLLISELKEALEAKQYHLIHYVGHASFNENYPQQSHLGVPNSHEKEQITASELHDLLLDSPTQFLYLSCCSGAEMGEPDRGNIHWGLLHAAINAGVSASLGFRWWVRLESACRFAEAFYKHIDDSPFSLERAAFQARKAIHNKDGWNETWFSPILVVQKPAPANSVQE